MECSAAMFGKASFVMGCGYNDNRTFLNLNVFKQDYVVRLTARRKLLFYGKWVMATEFRDWRKGKVRMLPYYKGKPHEAYLSHVKVRITASKKNIYLILVYGITEHPIMLTTNKGIKSKDDVIVVARSRCFRLKTSTLGS